MTRLAWIALALALAPAAALAEGSPAPTERPGIAAPFAGPAAPWRSPRPAAPGTDLRIAPEMDHQAVLGRAVEVPGARVLIRDRETGEVDELGIFAFLAIPPDAIDPDRFELTLIDPGAGAIELPHAEFQTFSHEHPEYGASAAIEPGGGWMPVRRAFFDTRSSPPPAAYHVILVAGAGLKGDRRMLSAGAALCGQAAFSEDEGLDPEDLAVIAAPVGKPLEEGDKVSLAEDYDFARAAYWLDTLSGTALGREAGARLGADAFGFVAAAEDPTWTLERAAPEEFDAADAIYIDLSAISPGYVEEVVARIVKGMREGDAVSHTGAIGVLEAFSLVERVGAATLEIAGLIRPSEAQAAPSAEGC